MPSNNIQVREKKDTVHPKSMHIGSLFQQLPHEPVPKYSNHPILHKLTLALQKTFYLSKIRDSKQNKGVFLRSKIITLADLQHRKNLTAKLTGSLFALVSSDRGKKKKKKEKVLQLIRKKRNSSALILYFYKVVIKISNLHFGLPRKRHTFNKSLSKRGTQFIKQIIYN